MRPLHRGILARPRRGTPRGGAILSGVGNDGATSVCVFCGSSTPADPIYSRAAAELAEALVSRGIEVVYGGGRVGLMGVLADAALAKGGRVTGVIPVGLS